MAFPGGLPAAMNPNAGMSEQEQQMVKAMQMGMESCLGKTAMAGVMGGGLGAMFGLFMASVSPFFSSPSLYKDIEGRGMIANDIKDALRHTDAHTRSPRRSSNSRWETHGTYTKHRRRHSLRRCNINIHIHPRTRSLLLRSRHAPHPRPTHPPHRPPPQTTTQTRPARHVPAIARVWEKLCKSRRHLLRHRMRNRGSARKE